MHPESLSGTRKARITLLASAVILARAQLAEYLGAGEDDDNSIGNNLDNAKRTRKEHPEA